MWESLTQSPHGRISVRKYLLVALAFLVACFMYTLISGTAVLAADAQVGSSGISYNDQTYSGPNTATGTESFNLPKDSVYYVYTEAAGTGNGGATPKAHLIYFAPGVDPSSATQASYQTFNHSSATDYSNPSAKQMISVEQASTTNPTNAGGTTSCAVEGIGWIVCPVTNFLAKGMDIIYKIVTEFLVVRPLETTGNNAMYRAWSVMRSVANVAFVIAFMIIIYSQLTSIGLSNYSIKKLLPRVIVAAILVNSSYWICAISIDICNILGYSLQDMFISIRNSLIGSEGNSWDVISWESVGSFILSGGTIVAGAGIAAYLGAAALGGVTITGLVFLFLPMLLSVLFVVLMTFLILAGRQAIITILVVLAPLAFVAYLLPNTEKWFEKWRSTFFTLLLVFPGFSLVFGGSQLAASIIIQNASSINVILLAMAVQVMPLAITPLLLRLGGGVLNRFAGIVNNPTKGLFDRGKAWSKERLEANQSAKMKRMAENPNRLNRFGPSRVAYARNQSRRRREAWKAANEATSDGHWKNTASYQRIQQRNLEAGQIGETGETRAQNVYDSSKLVANSRIQQRDFALRTAKLQQSQAETQAGTQWEDRVYNNAGLRNIVQATHSSEETGKALKAAVESANEAHWEQHATTDPGMRELRLEHHVDHQQAELAKKQWEAEVKEWASGKRPPTPYAPGSAMFNLIADTQGIERAIAVEGMRTQQAELAQKIDIAGELKTDAALRALAGGVMGAQGQNSVLASAKSVVGKALMDDIQNIQNTMDYSVATDINQLELEFSRATTLTQRIAYANAIAKNGGPGIKRLEKVIRDYEASGPATPDLLDFKELLGANGSIRQAGKHFDDWINNGQGPAVSFETIARDTGTWSNLSADKFANMNAEIQKDALDILLTNVPATYNALVEAIRHSPEKQGLIKKEVLEKMGIL